jgi:hypothetical protein
MQVECYLASSLQKRRQDKSCRHNIVQNPTCTQLSSVAGPCDNKLFSYPFHFTWGPKLETLIGYKLGGPQSKNIPYPIMINNVCERSCNFTTHIIQIHSTSSTYYLLRIYDDYKNIRKRCVQLVLEMSEIVSIKL